MKMIELFLKSCEEFKNLAIIISSTRYYAFTPRKSFLCHQQCLFIVSSLISEQHFSVWSKHRQKWNDRAENEEKWFPLAAVVIFLFVQYDMAEKRKNKQNDGDNIDYPSITLWEATPDEEWLIMRERVNIFPRKETKGDIEQPQQ